LRARDELIDLDCVVALDSYRVEFIVFNQHVLVLANLIPTTFLAGLDWLARHIIDELLPQAIAGRPVDLPESDPLRR